MSSACEPTALARRSAVRALAATLALACDAGAGEHVWLVGGGYDPPSSQVQIEQNVRWAREALQALPGERRIEVFFTDGDDPDPDVLEWAPPPEEPAALQPLARVMGNGFENGDRYRNHDLSGVRAGTRADALAAALGDGLAALGAGEDAFLAFNGHGTHDPQDTAGNRIALWDQTSLSVGELARILDRAPAGVTVRFLFTQCFAGAFARLARPDGTRCGFLAEAADQEAEGCLATVDLDEYRDYSTYFFAALTGRSRDGAALAHPPDQDGDGRVTLREAHLYTLLAARSADLPRATSEAYLLDWAPWYLRWARWAFPYAPRNEYAALASALARDLGIGSDGHRGGALAARLAALRAERAALAGERTEQLDTAELARATLEGALLRRWPQAATPYTLAYRRFLEAEVDPAQEYLRRRPEYATLSAAEARIAGLERRLIENERARSSLERVEHLWWLARLRALFEWTASERARAAYRRLVECEDHAL
jgi:hypothetical protein